MADKKPTFLGFELPFLKSREPEQAQEYQSYNEPTPRAFLGGVNFNFTSHGPLEIFDGEKNVGEIGYPKNLLPHHTRLRMRSWQFYLESEIVQLLMGRLNMWVIGKGLKLQADPNLDLLSRSGIDVNQDDFTKTVESLFKVQAASRFSDYCEKGNLHSIASEVFKHASIGGDMLCILRVEKGRINVQTVDGANVSSPLDTNPEGKGTNNRIVNGVEIDTRGRQVAYWVNEGISKWRRVSAKNAQGNTVAYMVYGATYRKDEQRGIPLISSLLETIAKLDRYKEATVGSAEERQKIAYYIYRDIGSQDENIYKKAIVESRGAKVEGNGYDTKAVSEQVATTTMKQTFDMPPGSKLGMLESKNELYFADFYKTNLRVISATIGMPMEVALSWYDSNYSASRAALKDWEHTIRVKREDFTRQFYKPYYDLWLDVQVLSGEVTAPGYLGLMNSRSTAYEAYRFCRFTGENIPHIDPEKEVRAERLKLGNDSIPLTSFEASTEAVNGGDFAANLAQYKREKDLVKKLGLEDEPIEPSNGNNGESE